MTRPEAARLSIKKLRQLLTSSSRRLLILAAVFHLAVTLTIYELGRQAILPSVINNAGIAVTLAPDSTEFLKDAAYLSEQLAGGHFGEWYRTSVPHHVRLYSLSLAVLSPLLAPSVLSAEPLN